MTKGPYIVSIDQGTTSSRVFVFDTSGRVIEKHQKKHQFILPQTHYVEHDPNEIWHNVSTMLDTVVDKYGKEAIKAIGITNQRETIVCWDKETGQVLHNALVWQDNRTEGYCQQLISEGVEDAIRQKTGLTINPYFSASKINWLLHQSDKVKDAFNRKTLKVGTIDCFLVDRLTDGRVFKTDVTNASRTLLFNIEKFEWDPQLLEIFSVPNWVLPEVVACDSEFGVSEYGIPITGVAGDQQSALIGQTCFHPGDAKMTFGTGGFFLVNIGTEKLPAPHGLLTTVAYELSGKRTYAIEGSIFHAASIINWLQSLGLISSPEECDELYQQATENSEVILVPAFTGLGAPHWRADLLAEWKGLSLSTGRAELVKSAIESIAFQSYDLFSQLNDLAMKKLKVDGGVANSTCLLQFLSNLSGLEIHKPKQLETTVFGALLVAGLGAGIFTSTENLIELWQEDTFFEPELKTEMQSLKRWQQAVQSVLN